MEQVIGEYLFSDDPAKVDLRAVHEFIGGRSYWAKNISFELFSKALVNSMCFGVYKGGEQVAFARWVTDKATFAYLCDVYVNENYRGEGIGKRLMAFMFSHPDLQPQRRYMLATRDAHGLYVQFGFEPIPDPSILMGITKKDPYGSLQ